MARPKTSGRGSGGAKPAVTVEALTHPADSRKNIPTAETQGLVSEDEARPVALRYPRNPDLDPQLVWKGKDAEDGADLRVDAVPIYIQEKIHPKAIIDDLKRMRVQGIEPQADLFADFNGLTVEDKLDFYAHDQHWSNRMILGDSLMVMASLAEKEALRGKVQMIYLDPPYGIKFGSNWQVSTRDRDVKDGKADYAPREPEVIKAFRDTWALGIHSYLSYLRDRLVLARELLSESGSIFVQIGVENVHRVRAILDEAFGEDNFVSLISFRTTSSFTARTLSRDSDYLLWYARNNNALKYRSLLRSRPVSDDEAGRYTRIEELNGVQRFMSPSERENPDELPSEFRVYRHDNMYSQGRASEPQPYRFDDCLFDPWKTNSHWKSNYPIGLDRLAKARRLALPSANSIAYVRYHDDFPFAEYSGTWTDTQTGAFTERKTYVVQTNTKVVERCLLMTTDPGDLVLDPTCGSGTTAYVAEQWGRRWITIDTSRVALTLARQRLMAARYPWYLLSDSPDGAQKEAELTGRPPAEAQHRADIRHGFVYERVPHVTLKSIANNAEIDIIHAKWHETMEPIRARLNTALGQSWEEWQIPREAGSGWSQEVKNLHIEWWRHRRARQAEIDASIAGNADVELLYDRPYERRNTVRVTGPFTVESLSPHRVLAPEEDDEVLLDALRTEAEEAGKPLPERRRLGVRPLDIAPQGDDDFVRVVLENRQKSGVQNTKKGERLNFTSLEPHTGDGFLHAQGRYQEDTRERLAAIFIGPEYGTVSRDMVMRAAREARDMFDVLVVCGFAFDAHVGSETMNLGRLTVLKARMNEDLHMAEHLKKTGAGNLFVVFGEPDMDVEPAGDGMFKVRIKGVDIFDPTTGEVRSSADPAEDIACWFLDSDYDGDSFFVRHAYFLGRDPYERLKKTLKAEIDEAAWETLNSTTSRPFPAPKSGRIAVKVINHYGDEVMKVFQVAG
jgi:adenine-specific DNA-methyltransferase